jgi:23S rRNA (adenine2503-C2)-methyltransferase
MSNNNDLRDISREDLAAYWVQKGYPRYRLGQVLVWLYGSPNSLPVAHIEEMGNLPLSLRADLRTDFQLFLPELVSVHRDEDSTIKFLLRLQDGETIESVLLPETIKTGFSRPRPWRRTLCLSSQVGCALGCTFCRTATMGLKRNLKCSEILGQVIVVKRWLATSGMAEERIRNLVFMGMGEPLHNYDHLVQALCWFLAKEGFDFSKRRITVSTSGLLPEIKRLIEETDVRLAISLNATDETTRAALMPITRKYSLADLIRTCRELPLAKAERITFEYVLLDEINDREKDAHRLVSLMHGVQAKINIIPFNEFPGSSFRCPSEKKVTQFSEILYRRGLQVTVRRSRGRGVLGACGQLRSAFLKNPSSGANALNA